MSFEVKDIVGLSKPLERLVEVTASGLGAVSKPYFIKKTAEAKAYEIQVVAKAMADSQQQLTHSVYDDGKIKIISPESQLDTPSLSDRATLRKRCQEIRQQQNVEAICADAAGDLQNESTVPEEKPELGWVARFMSIAADISADELQFLWGKILAGEIKKPGSFSLRTLDVLRNLSAKEAEAFAKLGNYIFSSGDKFFFIEARAYISTRNGGLTFQDILELKDAGLVFESDLEFSFPATSEASTAHLIYGPLILLFEREKDTPKIATVAGVLTKVGVELLKLLTIEPEMEYVSFAGQRFDHAGTKFAWASVTQIVDGKINYDKKTYAEPSVS